MCALTRDEQQLLNYYDAQRDELFALLQKLVQIDTQNFISHGREAEGQDYIQQWFSTRGFKTARYAPDSLPGFTDHPAYHPGRGTDHRENITAFYDDRTEEKQALMIAAHTDTMPVGDPEAWRHPPFGGVIEGGRLYGLGVGDNKAGLAAGMMAFKAMKALGIRLSGSLSFTAYVDEEYGGGGGALAACLAYPAASYLNLDGGNFELWLSAIGGGVFRMDIKYPHTTDTASTVFPALVQVHDALQVWKTVLQEKLAADPLYVGSDMHRSALRITNMRIGDSAMGLNQASLGFVVYTKENEAGLRASLEAVLGPVRKRLADDGFVLSEPENASRFFEYGSIDPNSPLLLSLEQSIQDARGRGAERKGACLSDLSIFQRYGSPDSMSFGILRDFALEGGAHQPDEFVELDEFLDYSKSLCLFLYRYLGGRKG